MHQLSDLFWIKRAEVISIPKGLTCFSVVAVRQESPVARVAPLRVRLRRGKPAHGMNHDYVGTRLALDARPSTIIVSFELPPTHQLQEIAPRQSNSFVVITQRIAFCNIASRRCDNLP